jgi:hypothetical protein
LPQACTARRACTALLERAVATSNCFQLLDLAWRHRIPQLRRRALYVGLTEFGAARTADPAGFLALSADALCAVLCSSGLMVDKEVLVFRALADWVAHDRAARMPRFHDMFGESARHLTPFTEYSRSWGWLGVDRNPADSPLVFVVDA